MVSGSSGVGVTSDNKVVSSLGGSVDNVVIGVIVVVSFNFNTKRKNKIDIYKELTNKFFLGMYILGYH